MKKYILNLLGLILVATAMTSNAVDYTYTNVAGQIKITGYTGPGGAVTIPSTIDGLPVAIIGEAAFSHSIAALDVTSVTIPNSVVIIEDGAFSGCDGMTRIILGNGVTSIGDYAFGGCAITSITIPSSISHIGSEVFTGCFDLTTINVGVNSYYCSVNGVLFNKSQTTLIQYPSDKPGAGYTIPSSVTFIDNWAFSDNMYLTSITIPGSVTNIGTEAFYNCEFLPSITIPSSVTYIGDGAFQRCYALKSVYFKGNAPGIGGYEVFVRDPGGWGDPDPCYVTVYYLQGAIGWGSTFCGRPTALSSGLLLNPLTVDGGTGGGSYTNGQKVTIKAVAPVGMSFVCWSDGDTNTSRIITMPATPLTYTATFTDIQKPAVAITIPANALRIVTNGPVTIRGTATDNGVMTGVFCRVNNGAWTLAATTNLTTNVWKTWSVPLTLTAGSNLVQAYSLDRAGNSSATSIVSCTYVVLGNLTIQTNGTGTVTRAPATALEVNQKYTLTAAPGTGSAFINWSGDLTSTNKVLSFTMSSNMTFRANFADIQKPTVAITSPTAAQRIVTNGSFTVRGATTDNGIVTGVFCRVNSGAWMNAATTNNWKSWSLPVTLTAGSNWVQACSVDSAGNVSATSGVSCTYVVLGNLTVTTNGVGTITRAPATPPEVGAKYTLTAAPGAGSVFINWSGDLTSTNKMLIFTMASNMTFAANFIDTQKPTVAITSPTAAQRIVTNGPVTVRGATTDNGIVTGVFCRVNSGAWMNAATTNNWKSWSIPMTLTAGSNWVQAYSADSAGNSSATSGVSCTYVVMGNLTVLTNGLGTITRAPATPPEVGAKYTLTAAPGLGSVFSNWTGDVMSTNKTITFIMASNMTFTANFTDTQKPTVAITLPTTALRIVGTNAIYKVSGTASDNKAVATVNVQFNGGEWTNAVTINSWKNWSLPVGLAAGTNTVRAYSVDMTGNCSPTSSVVCTYVEMFALADYYPLPLDAEWLYAGSDEYGNSAKIKTHVSSTNYSIISYTGRAALRGYTTNCVCVSNAYLNPSTMVAYETWEEYLARGDRYGDLGLDYTGGDSVRADRGWIVPLQMAMGEKALMTSDVYNNGQFVAALSMSLQLIEKTSVTVPAGIFTNVLHVRMTAALPDGTISTGDTWLAKSVGEIKYAGVSSDDLSNYELIQYSLSSASSIAAAEMAPSASADFGTQRYGDIATAPQAEITVDGSTEDWANVSRTSFSYASVTQDVAVALSGNNIALLLNGCPFSTSDTVLVYFKLRLTYSSGDARHSVDLWTSGSVLYGMIDGQLITGFEAVLLNGVLEVKFPVEQSPSHITIEEIGCGMDTGGGALTELFRITPLPISAP